MKKYLPYQIHHVYLHERLALPFLDTGQQGYYVVCWWHDFALGHFFIEPGASLAGEAYIKKLIAAIAPAIGFYTKLQEDVKCPWQRWIINQEFEEWSSWMRFHFAPFTQKPVPARVPVSVIICTHNRALQLQRCLTMLTHLPCLAEEIIVVDNAPRDNSSQAVVKNFKEAVYVREPRVGLDIARNTGIKQARFPVLAFVDDDVVVHPLWLYRVWETFEDPATVAMTGLVIAAELSTEAQCIFEKHWSFNRGYIDKTFDSSFLNATLAKGPPVWNIGAGANMAFRKEVFCKTGYFDELLDAGAAGCSGDSEMWYRILMHGYAIQYNPKAIVFHEHRKELKGLKKQIFHYMRGHAAAALFQQAQHQQAGYKRYLLKLILKSYSRAVVKGFPAYRLQYSTLWEQIAGTLSGLAYYYKHRNKSTRIPYDNVAHRSS